ncbi:hypothetical protein [Cerasicoccus maritimus]|uniref:hypothetical protein n=1 Tax=Cerasicoccus maritimus TaxID=490089 RepID=UPI00285258BD|nr:hypothetical protein [Cerasicoccus maritimus]
METIIVLLVAVFPLLAWYLRPGWGEAAYLLAAFVTFYFIFAMLSAFIFGIVSLYIAVFVEGIDPHIVQTVMSMIAYIALFTAVARHYFKEYGDKSAKTAPAQ